MSKLTIKTAKNQKTGKTEVKFIKKLEKWDLDTLREFSYQKQALVNALGSVEKSESNFWQLLRKRYNLDPKKGYRIDRKTKKILET